MNKRNEFSIFIFLALLFLPLTKSYSHDLQGEYLCRESNFSLSRTKVVVKNMEKTFGESDLNGTVLKSYKADVYFDGKKLQRANKEWYVIKRTKKVRKLIQLRHNDWWGTWVNGDDDTQGVKFIVKEKEFSEQSGTKWVTKRSVFCEPQ